MKRYSLSLRFDPRGWSETYEEEKNNLLYFLSGFQVGVKHIGATSYAGGMSNRNVDILIATQTMQDISSIQVRLQSKGYKLVDSTLPGLSTLVGPKKVNGYGITVRVMEYASMIYNRFNAFETLMKENQDRVTRYNEYREEISLRCGPDFQKYQELKLNYINGLIDEKFKFEY